MNKTGDKTIIYIQFIILIFRKKQVNFSLIIAL